MIFFREKNFPAQKESSLDPDSFRGQA
jgi:hypothetical protein